MTAYGLFTGAALYRKKIGPATLDFLLVGGGGGGGGADSSSGGAGGSGGGVTGTISNVLAGTVFYISIGGGGGGGTAGAGSGAGAGGSGTFASGGRGGQPGTSGASGAGGGGGGATSITLTNVSGTVYAVAGGAGGGGGGSLENGSGLGGSGGGSQPSGANGTSYSGTAGYDFGGGDGEGGGGGGGGRYGGLGQTAIGPSKSSAGNNYFNTAFVTGGTSFTGNNGSDGSSGNTSPVTITNASTWGYSNDAGQGGASNVGPAITGGTGVARIKYLGAQRAVGGTVTSVSGYTVHTFTSDGTLTITAG